MAREESIIETAFAWAVFACIAPCALLATASYDTSTWYYHRGIPTALQALAGVYALLAAGVGGAMAEPLPEDPGAGRAPLRLASAWEILGWCPPPTRWARVGLAAAAALLFLHPFKESGFFAYAAAAGTLLPALTMKRGKGSLDLGTAEGFLLAGSGLLGCGALYMTAATTAAEAWQGVAVLAALAALHGQRIREVTALRWAQLLPGLPPPPALDLSRYELSVEKKAAADRPALPAGAEAQLVDSGSFRVDPAKMLDKLRQYQLSDPEDFVCAWLRCAAASGAKAMSLTTGWTSLELSFDGRAFSASELSAPYQALVDGEGENARRGRHFAYGLLGLYRLRPRSVSVTSRGPAGVAAMNAGAGRPPDPGTAPEGTFIQVTWPAWALFWRPALLARRARERFGLGPAALMVNGQAVPDRPSDPAWGNVDNGGWRGVRKLPEFRSRVRLYVLGTFIEELEGDEVGIVEAWLAHDELELDISQAAVVRGRLLDAGLDLL